MCDSPVAAVAAAARHRGSGQNRVVHAPANVRVLSQAGRVMCQALDMLQNLGQGARRVFEALYNEKTNYQALTRVLGRALAHIRPKRT